MVAWKTDSTRCDRSSSIQQYALLVCVAVVLAVSVGAFMLVPNDPVRELARDLTSDDVETRYDAAKDLEELGPNAIGALDELSAALTDRELKVRYRAAKTLAEIGPPAAPAVHSLAAALQDPERDVRYYAAKALYKIDNDADDALEPIMEILGKGESDPDVRRYLVKTLGEIGEHDPDAQRLVQQLAGDKDQRVREEVSKVLAEFKEQELTIK